MHARVNFFPQTRKIPLNTEGPSFILTSMTSPQPSVADQLAGLRDATAASLAQGWLPHAVQALIVACLVRLFDRLESLFRLWQDGILPPLAPSPRADAPNRPAAGFHAWATQSHDSYYASGGPSGAHGPRASSRPAGATDPSCAANAGAQSDIDVAPAPAPSPTAPSQTAPHAPPCALFRPGTAPRAPSWHSHVPRLPPPHPARSRAPPAGSASLFLPPRADAFARPNCSDSVI